MSRRVKFLLQLIMWVAVGTLLFGIWATLVGVRNSPSAQTRPSAVPTNSSPALPSPQ